MTATISLVASAHPEGLLDAAALQGTRVAVLNTQIRRQQGAVAELSTHWRGAAATAAMCRADADLARQRLLADRLGTMSSALRSGGTNLAALRTQIQAVAAQAAALGGVVSDAGTVVASGENRLMTPVLAAAYTTTLKTLLGQFDATDWATAQALSTACGPPPKVKYTQDDLYPGDPSGADVNQDDIGDCYLLATMGAIADAGPQHVKDRISYNSQTGEFDVTLWDGGQWRHITVAQTDLDANIAANGGSGVDNYPSGGRPLWPAVLESAYLKMKAPGKGYEAIEQGFAPDAMEALTGNNGRWFFPGAEFIWNQHLDTEIATALADHQPVTLSTTFLPGPLAGMHVYQVTGITGTGHDAVVRLRNPWNSDDGPPLVRMKLVDLVGHGIPGLGPAAMVNIGQM